MLKNCSNFMDYSSYKKGRTDFSVAEVKGVVQSRGIGTKKEKMIKGWLVGYHLPLTTGHHKVHGRKSEDMKEGRYFHWPQLWSLFKAHDSLPQSLVHRPPHFS